MRVRRPRRLVSPRPSGSKKRVASACGGAMPFGRRLDCPPFRSRSKNMPKQRFATILLCFVACSAGLAHAQQDASAQVPSEAASGSTASTPAASEPRIIRGTGRVIAPPKTAGLAEGAPSAFKFEAAPIADVVQVILGEVLKVDYVLHQPIAGSITLATRGDVPADQAAFLLESALQANGLVMARDARGVYHVGRPEALKGIVAATRQVGSGPLPPGHGAIVVPLQYIGAAEMAAILRPMLPPEALVRVDNVRNLLLLVGTRTQAEGWLDIVSTFDVDLLKGMSVGVFPLKHASVREIEAALRMMTSGGAATSSAPAGQGTAGGGAAAAAAGGESTPLFGAVRILPIERINSVLVVTPRPAYLDEARIWIERLDRPSDNSSEPQLFVYPVQNGSAAHLADVLNGLFGADTKQGSTSTSGTGVAPGLATSTGTTGAFGSGSNALGLQSGSSTGFGSGSGLGGSSSLGTRALGQAGQTNQAAQGVTARTLNQGVRVIADEKNNAVLIYGSRGEYAKIESTLKRLDVPPTQVLIEATIIEVTLSDDLQYGLQWFFNDKERGGLTGTGVLSQSSGGTLGGAVAGFSYTLRNSIGDVRAVLNALAEKSLVRVISSPTLMVLDNHTAAISVGNQQPIRSSETITTGGNVSTSIQYKDTGVSLAVTPSVNAGNLVTMQINQAVTDVGQVDSATGQRTFLQRQIASKVAVRSSEALVLGGLIRDNTTTGKSGLPWLQDIPLVGNLFGKNNQNTARTELLVVITPRVVRSDIDVREVGSELRDRLKGLRVFEGMSGLLPAIQPARTQP